MRILMSGASGMVGRALIPELERDGHSVVRLVRRAVAGPDDIQWQPGATLDLCAHGVFDAVIHLAGENIAGSLWFPKFKARVKSSRVEGTRTIAEAVASAPAQPQVVISASAVGFYGSRGDEVMTEESASGTGYLAEIGRGWEAAMEPVRAAGVRLVTLRIGIVLGQDDGFLAKMLPVFKLGLGGHMGSGKQWLSWIMLEDLVAIIGRALTDAGLSGPVNAVAPNPVTNAEFTKMLARHLGRPAFFHVPRFVLKVLPGRMGDELFLSGQRVLPAKLQAAGFQFQYPEMAPALRQLLEEEKSRR